MFLSFCTIIPFFFLNFLCFLLFLTFVVYWNDVPIAPPLPPQGGGKGAWTQKSLCPNLEMGEELKGRGEQVGEVRKGEGWVQSWFHPGGASFNHLRGFPAASSRQQMCDPPPTVKQSTLVSLSLGLRSWWFGQVAPPAPPSAPCVAQNVTMATSSAAGIGP